MAEDQDAAARRDAHIDAVAPLLRLPIAPEHRPGVRTHLAVAEGMAAALDAADLDPEHLALASVFRVPEPSTPSGSET